MAHPRRWRVLGDLRDAWRHGWSTGAHGRSRSSTDEVRWITDDGEADAAAADTVVIAQLVDGDRSVADAFAARRDWTRS